MNQSRVRFLLFFSAFCLVEAQSPSTNPSGGGDAVSNFQPSLAVVIGILSVMFGLTFVLLLYTKCCHRGAYGDDRILLGGINRSRRFSGIDKTVVESLPFFRFSSLRGSKQGLECAVCLSKFEDVELLRLLPNCKHGFHINCIDVWLEKHSSCPLCRHKITPEDPDSTRFSLHEDSGMDLYVQREEACGGGSSRFSIGSSFRKTAPNVVVEDREEQQAPIRIVDDGEEEVLHKLNHRIVVFKNRWSNVSSSDLIFLNSEMMLINGMSSDRFPHLEDRVVENDGMKMKMKMKIKEEMDQKRLLESKVTNSPVPHPAASETGANAAEMSPKITGSERRVMSEITALSRFRNAVTGSRTGESSLDTTSCSNLKEDRATRLWLPIARRTVEWFANREKRRQHLQPTTQNLNNIV